MSYVATRSACNISEIARDTQRVVDDHVIGNEALTRVLLRYTTESVKEEAVTKLHDVGLVHTSNFLTI